MRPDDTPPADPGQAADGSLPPEAPPTIAAVKQPPTSPGSPGADDGLEATVVLPPPARPVPAEAPRIASTVGWFGKLPAIGDFAQRRLPDDFVTPWDRWLQEGLAIARDRYADRWMDLYMTFPVWRFALPAAAIDERCWAGVMLPSVDRVGRCFPLTIAGPLSRNAFERIGLIGLESRLQPFAEAGIAALEGQSLDAVDGALARLPSLGSDSGTGLQPSEAAHLPLDWWSMPTRTAAWPVTEPLAPLLERSAARLVLSSLAGRCLWWSPASSDQPGALRLAPFPPPPALLAELIGEG